MDIIGIAYTDSHNHNFRQFNENGSRLDKNNKVQSKVFRLARKYDVPVLFAGDMFHNQDSLSNVLLDKFLPKLYSWHKKTISYNITGNHDQCFPNTFEKQSPSYIKTFSKVIPNMKCIDFDYVDLSIGIRLHGIPYISLNQGFEDIVRACKLGPGKNILMIHTDLPGAKDTNYREVGTSYNINYDVFTPFDLVLSGHIHLPQELSDYILMMGSPNQQKKSDSGIKYGCYLIYSNMSWEFIDLKGPEFIELPHGEVKPDDYEYYFHAAKPRKKDKEQELTAINTDNISSLVKGYLKEEGIDSKEKRKLLVKVLKDNK